MRRRRGPRLRHEVAVVVAVGIVVSIIAILAVVDWIAEMERPIDGSKLQRERLERERAAIHAASGALTQDTDLPSTRFRWLDAQLPAARIQRRRNLS